MEKLYTHGEKKNSSTVAGASDRNRINPFVKSKNHNKIDLTSVYSQHYRSTVEYTQITLALLSFFLCYSIASAFSTVPDYIIRHIIPFIITNCVKNYPKGLGFYAISALILKTETATSLLSGCRKTCHAIRLPTGPEMTDIINILIRCEFAYHVEFGFICDY